MTRPWTLTVSLEDAGGPVYARIARAITDDIRRGRLRPGDALPGSRMLAASLGVHRNTVLAAYEALRAEAWIETESAAVTRVARALPERDGRRFSPRAPVREGIPDEAPYALPPSPPLRERDIPRGAIPLFGGMPDLSLFPATAYARAYRAALRDRRALLDYGHAHGQRALREALAAMLSSQCRG